MEHAHDVRKRRTIAAVDDDERALRLLVDTLESDEQTVVTFATGESLLSFLDETPECDLLILDIEMPVMDGYDVARAVRRLPGWPQLPILALSGLTGADIADRILDAGANAYRSKPVSIAALREAVSTLLPPTFSGS